MIYLDKKEITIDELRELCNTSEDVIELVDVDEHDNLHFELHTYGLYY